MRKKSCNSNFRELNCEISHFDVNKLNLDFITCSQSIRFNCNAIIYAVSNIFLLWFFFLDKINVIDSMNTYFSGKGARKASDAPRRTFKAKRAQLNHMATLQEIASVSQASTSIDKQKNDNQ